MVAPPLCAKLPPLFVGTGVPDCPRKQRPSHHIKPRRHTWVCHLERSADRPTWNRRKEKEPARSRTFFTRGSVKKARGTSEISGGVLRIDKPFLNSNLLLGRIRKRHYRSQHCVLPSEASQAQPSSGSTALRMTLLFFAHRRPVKNNAHRTT